MLELCDLNQSRGESGVSYRVVEGQEQEYQHHDYGEP